MSLLVQSSYTPIPNFKRYGVSKYGDIIHLVSGKMVETFTDGRDFVRAKLIHDRGKEVTVYAARLVLETFQPLKDSIDPSFASVVFRDGNRSNLNIDNLFWDIRGYVPLFMPGINCHPDAFVRIPGFSNYEINLNGVVKHIRTKNILSIRKNKGGYLELGLTDNKGVDRTCTVHRLLALTFLAHPNDVDHLVVNHKDGNKNNNLIWNLEWTTNAKNNEHAAALGLREERRKILLLRIDTRELSELPSIAECARFLNVSSSTLREVLTNPNGIRPYHGYYIKFAEDQTPWPDKNLPDTTDNYYPILIKSLSTEEIKKFKSMADAAEYLKVSPSSIYNQATYEKARPYKGHLIRRNTPFIDWSIQTERSKKTWLAAPRVKTTDLVTKEEKIWISVHSLSRTLRIPRGSIWGAIHRGTPCRNRYLIEYVNEAIDEKTVQLEMTE